MFSVKAKKNAKQPIRKVMICQICGIAAKGSSNLNKHLRLKHSESAANANETKVLDRAVISRITMTPCEDTTSENITEAPLEIANAEPMEITESEELDDNMKPSKKVAVPPTKPIEKRRLKTPTKPKTKRTRSATSENIDSNEKKAHDEEDGQQHVTDDNDEAEEIETMDRTQQVKLSTQSENICESASEHKQLEPETIVLTNLSASLIVSIYSPAYNLFGFYICYFCV